MDKKQADKLLAVLFITNQERDAFRIEAEKEGLKLNAYLRKKLGMPLLQKANNFLTNNPRKKS